MYRQRRALTIRYSVNWLVSRRSGVADRSRNNKRGGTHHRTHDDIREILPQTSVGTRRKLSQVAEYLSEDHRGHCRELSDNVRNSSLLSDRATPAPPATAASSGGATCTGAPRMSINGLKNSQVANEWLDWHMG
jgi:hypothetical protein